VRRTLAGMARMAAGTAALGRGRRPPVRRREQGAEARRAILAATERLLDDRQLDDLTVVDVIEAAGVSRASFYMYFESKHAAVAALAETVLDGIMEEIWRPMLAGAEPVDEALFEQHLHESFARWQAHGSVLVAAAQGWRTRAADYAGWGAAFAGYVDDMARFIERVREAADGVPDALDARTLAALLVWQNENVLYLALTGDAPELVLCDELAQTIAGLWLRAIYGTPPG